MSQSDSTRFLPDSESSTKASSFDSREQRRIDAQFCFEIIAQAGSAKSLFIEAIRHAKNRQFQKAEENVRLGEQALTQAHKPHFELITKEAQDGALPPTLLMIHAEDQFMAAEQFKIMAEEMIDLYRLISK